MDLKGQPSPARTGQNTGQKVRRPRAARACDLCRAKKNKCDELYPSCTYCRERNVECRYKGQDANRRRFTPEYVRHLEDLVRQLSAPDVAREPTRSEPPMREMIACTPQRPLPVQHEHEFLVPMNDTPTIHVAGARKTGGQEVSGINRHTRSVEFYGRSSSLVLLCQVQCSGGEDVVALEDGTDSDGATIVSSLHNPVFTPPGPSEDSQRQSSEMATHYSQCRAFLNDFFSSIHYIHPIIDKAGFFKRCERLWSGTETASRISSFVALYYSLLSLGALVGVRGDEPIDGLGNVQWSRKFFDEARSWCDKLGMVTDLHMVQCYFFMAKVCQNELNPHLSYMYVGLAVRTALAMGINREPVAQTKKDPAELRAEARTWWGIYSLETEVSFAMGRPDTLGADSYHNRRFSHVAGDGRTETAISLDPPFCSIIKPMVDFSKIIRKVCLGIYLKDHTSDIVSLAYQIERELDEWVDGLPHSIRPRTKPNNQPETLRGSKEPRWSKRQKLVLLIRYHNLRILLFGSLLLTSTHAERVANAQAAEAIRKCLESAKQTIHVIYEVFQHHEFFHTWFYNTTYTVFAASIILVYVTQEATESELGPLLKLVSMAVEILETMDECVVAIKAAQLLRRASEKAGKKFSAAESSTAADVGEMHAATSHENDAMLHLNQYWGPLSFAGGEMDMDFGLHFGDLDGAGSLLMTLAEQSPV